MNQTSKNINPKHSLNGGSSLSLAVGSAKNSEIDNFGFFGVPCSVFKRPYLVYNETGYSKHYYAGAERVSSRIGGGMQNALLDPLLSALTPLTDPPNYSLIIEDQARMLQRQISCVGMNPSYVHMESQFHSVAQSTQMADPEDNWYIYHSDHLGSSAFLTDAGGTPTQHLQYLPFGEPFIEQRSVTEYFTPYTFSAKERDLETGYSYFGARYYDAGLSVWLSVDPLSDKYPSMSAYMYCAGNPVMLVDPDGREIHPTGTEAVQVFESYLQSYPGVNAGNFEEAFGIKKTDESIYTSIKAGSGYDQRMTKREFRKNYQEVTGERLRGKRLKDAYQVHEVVSSKNRVEFSVFRSTTPTLGQPIEGTTIVDHIDGIRNPVNRNPHLAELRDHLRNNPNTSSEEFNQVFSQSTASLSGKNWKLFGYVNPRVGGNKVMPVSMSQHHGSMVINGNTAATMESKHLALKEMLRLF